MKLLSFIFAATLFFSLQTVDAADKAQAVSLKNVQSLMNKYCVRCHGEKKKAGKVDLSSSMSWQQLRLNRKVWQKALDKIKDEEMPPEKPLPSKAERQQMIDWLEAGLKIDWTKVKHPGHVTMPRMNLAEYSNTMRDLLGIPFRAGDQFTEDGEGESGFNNDRAALFIPPALMEKYFAAANSSLDELIGVRLPPISLHFEAEKMFMTEQNSPPTDFGYVLNRGQMTLYDSVTFPRSGTYVFTVRSWAIGNATAARLRMNDEVIGDILVPTTKPGEYTITAFVKAGAKQMAWNIQNPNQVKIAKNADTSVNDVDQRKKKRKPQKSFDQKAAGKIVNEQAPKNASVFAPIKDETGEIRKLRNRLNSAALSLQRPYEWLRQLGPDGEESQIIRFKGYIADRAATLEKVKKELAQAMKIELEELNKQIEQQNTERLADNLKLLAAVKDIKSKAKPKKKQNPNKPPKPGNVAIDWIKIHGPVRTGTARKTPLVFVSEPGQSVSKQIAARTIVSQFAKRAFRRPVTDKEIIRYLALFNMSDKRGDSFEDSIKLSLSAILVSPNFLLRTELGPKPEGEFRLDDFQLASRLSYFLWLSMPDVELFDLAEKRKLHEPNILRAQVKRMLNDEKSKAFTLTFSKQWLGIGALEKEIGPDPKKFPIYTSSLQQSIIDETVMFFDSVVRENRSLLELLESKETYLNEELARLYGIKDVKGSEMRKVKLDDANRGGVLSMASVLTATSLPLRTSPVIRGKWVLETIFGEEQPPPLPTAAELPEDAAEKKGQTLREVFELHRKAPECASCHVRMDPIGFGLENFDAIGRFRTKQGGKDIDSSGVLPDGEKFRGPAELKQIMLKSKARFAQNLSERMLSFALGRRLEYYDEPAIRKITQSLVERDYSPAELISAVVESYPFQYQHSNPVTEETQ